MTTATSHSDGHGHGHAGARPGELQVHAVPIWLLLAVFGALLVLTVMTVLVTKFDFGNFNIYVALAIAVVKATLVALYFMHLRWDAPFNSIVLFSALVFVAIFIGTTITDSSEYKVNYNPPANSLAAQQQ
jgi:cytochrome c oxidase subunit 4